MDDLLPELLQEICNFLPCKSIILFSLCFKKVNNIVNDNDLINKKKYEGYPREEGQCLFHNITKYVNKFKLDYKIYKLHDDSGQGFTFSSPGSVTCINVASNTLETTSKIIEININILLDLLIAENPNLIRGDIIGTGIFNFIFDGCKIIGLKDYNNKLTIPHDFIIGTNNINLNYWRIFNYVDEYKIPIGNDKGFFVYSFSEDIRKQLLSNIEHEINERHDIYSSKFTINNITYHILSYLYIHNNNNNLKLFTQLLSYEENIILACSIKVGYKSWNGEFQNNTYYLFTGINY